MEPDADQIADIARKTGATEAEARVIYHIRAMNRAFRELSKDVEDWVRGILWLGHSDALMNAMLSRIARRDHPEGFPTPQDDEA